MVAIGVGGGDVGVAEEVDVMSLSVHIYMTCKYLLGSDNYCT